MVPTNFRALNFFQEFRKEFRPALIEKCVSSVTFTLTLSLTGTQQGRLVLRNQNQFTGSTPRQFPMAFVIRRVLIGHVICLQTVDKPCPLLQPSLLCHPPPPFVCNNWHPRFQIPKASFPLSIVLFFIYLDNNYVAIKTKIVHSSLETIN